MDGCGDRVFIPDNKITQARKNVIILNASYDRNHLNWSKKSYKISQASDGILPAFVFRLNYLMSQLSLYGLNQKGFETSSHVSI